MLQSEQGLIIFVSAMDPYNENMMADVLRVAAAVCLVADGYASLSIYVLVTVINRIKSIFPPTHTHTRSHDRVLEAVTVNGETCGINRFDPVLQALKKTINPMLQLSCLQFINAIVNTPDDIDFKLHLRNEFMRGGLEDVLVVSVCVCVMCEGGITSLW